MNCNQEHERWEVIDCDDPTQAAAGQPDEAVPQRGPELTRRSFLTATGLLTASLAAGVPRVAAAQAEAAAAATTPQMADLALTVNGKPVALSIDTRTSLLDLLRETLDLTGSKKGCDHGQCGACTVILDGQRVNSCLTLAVAAGGASVTTIEGLGAEHTLSPMQAAFVEHDGLQCGYCTPGQICSATALLDEMKRGELSLATFEAGARKPTLTDSEIKERMSGNICRCGAYPNIVAAVRQVGGMHKAGGAA